MQAIQPMDVSSLARSKVLQQRRRDFDDDQGFFAWLIGKVSFGQWEVLSAIQKAYQRRARVGSENFYLHHVALGEALKWGQPPLESLGPLLEFCTTFLADAVIVVRTLQGECIRLLTDKDQDKHRTLPIETHRDSRSASNSHGDSDHVWPVQSAFDSGAASAVARTPARRRVFFIGVSGCSGVGKSTVCEGLGKYYGSPISFPEHTSFKYHDRHLPLIPNDKETALKECHLRIHGYACSVSHTEAPMPKSV